MNPPTVQTNSESGCGLRSHFAKSPCAVGVRVGYGAACTASTISGLALLILDAEGFERQLRRMATLVATADVARAGAA